MLENQIRKYKNKKQFKIISISLFNNLDDDERLKISDEIKVFKQVNIEMTKKFNLT